MIDDSMSTTEHLIRTLSPAQRVALDRIATALPPECASKTLRVLERRGLIIGESGALGQPEYRVPTSIHALWAQICSEEFDALSSEERAALEAPDV